MIEIQHQNLLREDPRRSFDQHCMIYGFTESCQSREVTSKLPTCQKNILRASLTSPIIHEIDERDCKKVLESIVLISKCMVDGAARPWESLRTQVKGNGHHR